MEKNTRLNIEAFNKLRRAMEEDAYNNAGKDNFILYLGNSKILDLLIREKNLVSARRTKYEPARK